MWSFAGEYFITSSSFIPPVESPPVKPPSAVVCCGLLDPISTDGPESSGGQEVSLATDVLDVGGDRHPERVSVLFMAPWVMEDFRRSFPQHVTE